jgi:HSP20 family protein
MNVTNWRGFAPASTFQRSLDTFFSDRYRSLLGMDGDFSPAVNTKEAKESFTLEIAVPGMKKEDFNITLNDGILTVSCQKTKENDGENDGYLTREFSASAFSRSFSLPKDVDDEHVSASYEDGILRINLPRETVAEENEAVRTVLVR